MELTRFRRLLALGTARWRLFFVTRAAGRPAAPVTAPDGTRMTCHDQRPTTDASVFGNLRFWRHDFTATGREGFCPLDAERSLPARCDADRLREWAAYGATDESSRASETVRERILGRSLSIHALETGVAAAAEEVPLFDEAPADPTASPAIGTILVVQADGQGGPMVQPPTQVPGVRLGKGQKRGTTKEAVVTGLDTSAPSPRTPQEVVGALLQEPERPTPAARPRPEGKERRATWAGKGVAMRRLAQRVAQREGPQIEPRVALTDGAEALPQQWVTHLPAYTLILDIIHATASRWDTANALLGETPPPRLAWVRASLEPLLAGQTDAVLTALAAEANDPTRTVPQRQAVQRPVGDSRRNRPSMRDDESLARGWPMGTGVVEGAWRHLVNDRLEPSGRRWTTGGAQAVLDLRAVQLNGHWEAYWEFHRHQQLQRLYGGIAPAPALAEAPALEWAA